MKNQESKIEKSEKIQKDSINLESAKINLSKGKKELCDKESKTHSRKDLYNGINNLSSDDQKKFRQKIRNQLKRFVSAILGKDRNDSEKEKSIQDFLSFYKENWRINDFKIENFSQSKNPIDLKDYSTLLEYVKSTLE